MKTARHAVALMIAALMLVALAFTAGCGKKQFKIQDKRVVTELDEKGNPPASQAKSLELVEPSAKAVYFWFKYPRLAKMKKVKWEITRTDESGSKEPYGGDLELKQGSTHAYFGIVLNEGASLPPGEYEMNLKESSGVSLLKDPADPKKEQPVKFTVKEAKAGGDTGQGAG